MDRGVWWAIVHAVTQKQTRLSNWAHTDLLQRIQLRKRRWCWEILKAEGKEGNRRWDGWVASLIQWTWTWANSGRWWGTEKPGMLQSMEMWRVTQDLVTEQQPQQLRNSHMGEMHRARLWAGAQKSRVLPRYVLSWNLDVFTNSETLQVPLVRVLTKASLPSPVDLGVNRWWIIQPLAHLPSLGSGGRGVALKVPSF